MSSTRQLCISLLLASSVAVPSYAQITWNNVGAGPTPNTSGQMGAARNSMNDAFGQFQNMISASEATQRANWENAKNNNTQTYLNDVYSYRTVKDLVANRDKLEAKLYIYGAQIDQNIARNAYDARLLTLMQIEKAAQ